MRALLWLVLLLLSCGGGTAADPGRDAALLVDGATFFRASMPAPGSGPAVAAVDLALTTLAQGARAVPLRGTLAPGATAAAIALEGDAGYWIVPASVPAADAPDFPTFAASVSVARTARLGVHTLLVRAVDGRGAFGEERRTTVTVTRVVPTGALVFALVWDTEADLDLHVIDPTGAEIWARNLNSWKPPPLGTPTDPDAWKSGGILDFDSNAACLVDGRRQENVTYASAPPRGRYVVRVDTPSLCGEVAARWHLAALRDGAVLAHAEGTSLPSDTRGVHGAGSGALALELDVP